MTREELQRKPIDVVTACRLADLAVLRIALDALRRFVPCRRIYVFTARQNFRRFRDVIGSNAELIDEDDAIPDLTLTALKKLTLPGFPKGAGWYFQQLLKLSFGNVHREEEYYLIWDADTIPLRPLKFFEEDGRMIFTMADEEHAPYFETYRKLLAEEPVRDFSFIAQHMIVQKSILREMFGRIESNFPGDESWAWKIMQNLPGSSTNLFSEYETLGHFVKIHYPERAAYLRRQWLRDGSRQVCGLPTPVDLQRLATQYDFVAFESSQRPLRRTIRSFRRWWRGD